MSAARGTKPPYYQEKQRFSCTRSSFRRLAIRLIFNNINATSFGDADDGDVPGRCLLGNIIVRIDVDRLGLKVEFADGKSTMTAVGIFSGIRLGEDPDGHIQ